MEINVPRNHKCVVVVVQAALDTGVVEGRLFVDGIVVNDTGVAVLDAASAVGLVVEDTGLCKDGATVDGL